VKINDIIVEGLADLAASAGIKKLQKQQAQQKAQQQAVGQFKSNPARSANGTPQANATPASQIIQQIVVQHEKPLIVKIGRGKPIAKQPDGKWTYYPGKTAVDPVTNQILNQWAQKQLSNLNLGPIEP